MQRLPHAQRLSGRAEPASLFAVLAESDGAIFWLDEGFGPRSGWSIVGEGTPVRADEVAATVIDATPEPEWPAGPFRGGWVGWLDYDGGALAAGAPASASEVPARWLLAERWIAIDHTTGDLWLVADPDDTGARAWALGLVRAPAPRLEALPRVVVAEDRVSAAVYAAQIVQCREQIRLGNAYQLCLTTRFRVPGRHRVGDVARRLCADAGAVHAAAIRIGDVAVVSASPEEFLSVRGEVVRTRPIKGTRPRSADPAEDAALAEALHASEKERAENVMIVDLSRNDLAIVCEPGSVHVPDLWQVEHYPAVHQLVSTVAGRVRAGLTVGQLWAATFPAGSMTGAPKRAAMSILHTLEDAPRGAYSGCLGWVGFDGQLELSMAIRCVTITDADAHVGAGGGITWGSVVEDEVAEVGLKAAGPLRALGAVTPAGW